MQQPIWPAASMAHRFPMVSRAAALAGMLLAVAVAGCLGPGSAPPPGVGPGPSLARLVCFEGLSTGAAGNASRVCNFQATSSPATRQANELSIAVNPLDPDNIIATGKDYTPDYAGQCVWDGLYATKDGGKTWTDQNVPGSPWKALNDPSNAPSPPPETSKFYCATDPVVAFGPDGMAYWAVMPYQCDPASGSRTGREVVPGSGVGLPPGGLNDWFWTCSSMYVLVSTDGGMTWPVDKMRQVAFGPRLEHDKMWLSIAPDGTALLCWDRSPATDPQANNGVLPVPLPSAQPPPPLPHSAVVCSLSKDQGDHWSELHDLSTVVALPWVDYGPDNHAFGALIDGTDAVVAESDDGVTWKDPVKVGPYALPPANAEYGWPGLNGSKFRVLVAPSIAVDRSDGPFKGSLYVVWMTYNGQDADVVLSFSRDAGATWSSPVKVHDDNASQQADQFMPAVSVGPDGTVDVSWHDRRWDPVHHLIDLAYTYSIDGGRTFAPNLRVSEQSSDEQYSHHQNGAIFLGDYRDSDSSAGKAYLVWVDTRNAKADAFVAIVERPGANPAAASTVG